MLLLAGLEISIRNRYSLLFRLRMPKLSTFFSTNKVSSGALIPVSRSVCQHTLTPRRAELEASKQAKSAAYIHVIEHYVTERNACVLADCRGLVHLMRPYRSK